MNASSRCKRNVKSDVCSTSAKGSTLRENTQNTTHHNITGAKGYVLRKNCPHKTSTTQHNNTTHTRYSHRDDKNESDKLHQKT